jgi:hypothetical protein
MAQIQGMTATVADTAPGAMLHSGGASSTLKQGATLRPGDMIDTGLSGRVVINLGDGSQVVIFPRSHVQLKDFQSAGTWRDLLKVTAGRVRATINHGKRPNPYRVYSPIASIAVRGTDFLVTVEPSTETSVLVYEGLVEVGSLVNPQKTVLVQPGRNIIVRPDGDISMVTTAPRSELNEIRSLQTGIGQEFSLRDAYNSHGNSYTGLVPARFTAFNDSYLDGLRNPAYATEIRHPGGRLYLIPSFSPERRAISNLYSSSSTASLDSTIQSNYTLAPQISYFIPLGSRVVVGAGAAVTKTDIGATDTEQYYYDQDQFNRHRYFEGNVKFTTSNLFLIAARRFGRAGRTSFGVKFDYLIDQSRYSFNRDTGEPINYQPTFEEGKEFDRRASLSVGLTQEIGDDKKLGIYYRYRMGLLENRYRDSGSWMRINDEIQFSPGGDYFRERPGHSSEAGVLFRGSVTRRLFYGVESSILFEQDQAESKYFHTNIVHTNTLGDITYISTQTYMNKRRVGQGMIGGGIGYALRKRSVISLDLSIGRGKKSALGQNHFAGLPPGVFQYSTTGYDYERSYFKSLHIGGQTDVWRNLFVGAAWFYTWERKISGDRLYWEEPIMTPQTVSQSENLSNGKRKLSNYSAGWRLTPNWIVQYAYSGAYSYSNGPYTPSHTLMFRYEFGRREEESPDQYPEQR